MKFRKGQIVKIKDSGKQGVIVGYTQFGKYKLTLLSEPLYRKIIYKVKANKKTFFFYEGELSK